jgi:hypothetical protein
MGASAFRRSLRVLSEELFTLIKVSEDFMETAIEITVIHMTAV